MTTESVLLIDPWTLRCFFNCPNYQHRFDLGEFEVEIQIRKKVRARPGIRAGLRHAWVIARRNGEDVFQAHRFVDEVTHAPESPLDPKIIQHKGATYQKDESIPNPYDGRRYRGRVYGWWRKSTCSLLRYRWFWTLTVLCFPRTKDALQTIRESFHRIAWIICANVYAWLRA